MLCFSKKVGQFLDTTVDSIKISDKEIASYYESLSLSFNVRKKIKAPYNQIFISKKIIKSYNKIHYFQIVENNGFLAYTISEVISLKK